MFKNPINSETIDAGKRVVQTVERIPVLLDELLVEVRALRAELRQRHQFVALCPLRSPSEESEEL